MYKCITTHFTFTRQSSKYRTTESKRADGLNWPYILNKINEKTLPSKQTDDYARWWVQVKSVVSELAKHDWSWGECDAWRRGLIQFGVNTTMNIPPNIIFQSRILFIKQKVHAFRFIF